MLLKLQDVFIFLIDFLKFLIQVIFLYLHSLIRLFIWPSKKSVAGQHVLITGAGHGLGREMALEFAKRGANLTLWDINKQSNEDTANKVHLLGVKVQTFTCDVSIRDEVIKTGKEVLKDIGPVDILINNAGIMPCKPFLCHTSKDIQKMMDINVMAHFWMLQTFLPKMRELGKGHIVAMSSYAGRIGFDNIVPYCASKFAVAGLMESLEMELRKDKCDIKFTTVFPATLNTGLVQKPRKKYPIITAVVEPDVAARRIIDGIQRNSSHIYIPVFYEALAKISMIIPRKGTQDFLDITNAGADKHDD